uniref:Uncharacterized protein n=1 Tax=Romanomermis culicivorax TaxID=13658 RepID=A0A915JBD6_ROMCU
MINESDAEKNMELAAYLEKVDQIAKKIQSIPDGMLDEESGDVESISRDRPFFALEALEPFSLESIGYSARSSILTAVEQMRKIDDNKWDPSYDNYDYQYGLKNFHADAD